MKLTGNENIDKHIKRGLGPMDKVNMDDYWSPHIPFLEYITEVGSEDDIKTMLEDNFGGHFGRRYREYQGLCT